MPRNVRNSWIDLSVDGRSDIGTGPVSAEGEMCARFRVRDKGGIVESVTVTTMTTVSGNLFLFVHDPDGNLIFTH